MWHFPIRRFIAYGALFLSGWFSSWCYFYSGDNIQDVGQDKLQNRTGDFSLNHAPQVPLTINSTTAAKENSLPNTKSSDYERAVLLLANRQYTQYIQMYIELRTTADESQIARHQTLVLDSVKYLQQKKSHQQALELLSLFLEFEYDNSTALLLFAELQHTQKNYLASMDALFRARSYAHESDAIDVVNKKLRALISEQRRSLGKQDDPLALLDFYRRLTELEPDYGPNFIGLAEVYIKLGNSDGARYALSMVAQEPSISERLDRAYAKLNQTPVLDLEGATSVQLLALHNQFLIDVVINGAQTARLLLDTGASISIISPSILNALGLNAQPATKTGWFNTANGVVSAPIYQLQSLSVDEFLLESIDVGVLSISNSGDIEGLLGMNFLKHFKFYIDQQKNVLFLRQI